MYTIIHLPGTRMKPRGSGNVDSPCDSERVAPFRLDSALPSNGYE